MLISSDTAAVLNRLIGSKLSASSDGELIVRARGRTGAHTGLELVLRFHDSELVAWNESSVASATSTDLVIEATAGEILVDCLVNGAAIEPDELGQVFIDHMGCAPHSVPPLDIPMVTQDRMEGEHSPLIVQHCAFDSPLGHLFFHDSIQGDLLLKRTVGRVLHPDVILRYTYRECCASLDPTQVLIEAIPGLQITGRDTGITLVAASFYDNNTYRTRASAHLEAARALTQLATMVRSPIWRAATATR